MIVSPESAREWRRKILTVAAFFCSLIALPWNWQDAKSPLQVDPEGPKYIEQEYPLELLMKIPKIAAQVHVGRIERPEDLQGAPPSLTQ